MDREGIFFFFLQYHLGRDFFPMEVAHYFKEVFLEDGMRLFKGLMKITTFPINSKCFQEAHLPLL